MSADANASQTQFDHALPKPGRPARQPHQGAWAEGNELVLGQWKVADQSNEITAVPSASLPRRLPCAGILGPAPSRNDAVEIRVERATGPFRRATRPPIGVRRSFTKWCLPFSQPNPAAGCRRERPGWPFHPASIASFRIRACLKIARGCSTGRSMLPSSILRQSISASPSSPHAICAFG